MTRCVGVMAKYVFLDNIKRTVRDVISH